MERDPDYVRFRERSMLIELETTVTFTPKQQSTTRSSILFSSQSSLVLPRLFLPLPPMFSNFIKLILSELVQCNMEMRAWNISSSLETRSLKKLVEPLRDLGIWSERGNTREILQHTLV
jgi:hypothetical protein